MTCPYQAPHPALTALTAAASPDTAAMQSFYRELSKRSTLQFDPASSCWIAASPELALAALQHDDLGVRPPGQAVPPNLQGRPFGAVFARWLRMRDDGPREAEKLAVQAALDGLEPALVRQVAERQAGLALQLDWRHWQWASLPCTVAGLLGTTFSHATEQQALLANLAALALALKPQADPAALEQGDRAMAAILALLDGAAPGPLAQALQAQARLMGLAETADWWQAQALALLWQGYEAGAGLLGLGLLAATHSSASAPRDLAACTDLLKTVGRQPGAIHHTRRWALRDCVLAGQPLRAGDALLVILVGGADPKAEPLGFGSGRHRCPGITLTLNAGAVALWLAMQQPTPQQTPRCAGFQALANARIPILNNFESEQEQT
ncbi:cytochrome P450 family protein [Roseateles oligotrophus]|uniref:Cytochrome P450 n=1 Tax=Roseateles oligotrophus TaxID=1769250 RepID=A0ABT2YHG3_9BURK|nr:hypothetical protein [Roseateles oligotrophus]MCV2369497.1 hypothetical protein [Roseateles oligotrophus]